MRICEHPRSLSEIAYLSASALARSVFAAFGQFGTAALRTGSTCMRIALVVFSALLCGCTTVAASRPAAPTTCPITTNFGWGRWISDSGTLHLVGEVRTPPEWQVKVSSELQETIDSPVESVVSLQFRRVASHGDQPVLQHLFAHWQEPDVVSARYAIRVLCGGHVLARVTTPPADTQPRAPLPVPPQQ